METEDLDPSRKTGGEAKKPQGAETHLRWWEKPLMSQEPFWENFHNAVLALGLLIWAAVFFLTVAGYGN